MVLIHLSRVVPTLFRGAVLKPQAGAGVTAPHVYTARANPLLDIDQFLHMNNAAYATHFECARWEMGASSGMLSKLARMQGAFVVASMTLRFRKEVRPMQSFEIHSSVIAADERQVFIKQVLQEPNADRIMAARFVGLCSAKAESQYRRWMCSSRQQGVDADMDELEKSMASAVTAERDALAAIEDALTRA